jgi:hypothetical protein
MELKLVLDSQEFTLNVPDTLVADAEDFFAKMDRDMDQGWQIGREWVGQLDKLQRCQVVANKLLTAMETENHDLGRLMAGYIVSRAPEIESIEPDIHGEPLHTLFQFREHAPTPRASVSAAPPTNDSPGATAHVKMAALAQAGQQVSKVFRAGKQWKFSVLDAASGNWEESPAIASEQEAERLREAAVHQRYQELCDRS